MAKGPMPMPMPNQTPMSMPPQQVGPVGPTDPSPPDQQYGEAPVHIAHPIHASAYTKGGKGRADASSGKLKR